MNMLENYLVNSTRKSLEAVRGIIAEYERTGTLPKELEDVRFLFEYSTQKTTE